MIKRRPKIYDSKWVDEIAVPFIENLTLKFSQLYITENGQQIINPFLEQITFYKGKEGLFTAMYNEIGIGNDTFYKLIRENISFSNAVQQYLTVTCNAFTYWLLTTKSKPIPQSVSSILLNGYKMRLTDKLIISDEESIRQELLAEIKQELISNPEIVKELLN